MTSGRKPKPKKGPDGKSEAPPPAQLARRGRLSAWIGLAVGALAIGGIAVWFLLHRAGPLGPLPAGLKASDLDLVVVTLDTTRADRIGCYGSKDVATPNLDRLAARGTLFENAISPTPLTLPAHCSLFTGLLPAAHGVRDNGGFRLSADHPTLAAVLAKHGWATGGFIAAYVLDHHWGIAQGFQRYFDDFDLSKYKTVSMGDIQRPGDEVVAKGLEWIGATAPRGKFFAWIHLYDPHSPYDPPEPFRSRYADHPYNGEIAWTDSLVGRLIDGLDKLGLTERTVVAVIGDHGESLGEHGEVGHGFFVYEPTTRVPFLLAGPYPGLGGGRRVRAVARHIDLVPTLLELLGVKDGPAVQGTSVVPRILAAGRAAGRGDDPAESGPPGYSEAFYSRFHYGWSELRAIRTERWHFIEAPRPELYDLAKDPLEAHNLAASERATVAKLRGRLAALDKETAPGKGAPLPVEEDEQTLRKLAALGYVGSFSKSVGNRSFRDLPDPKDRIHIYNLMSEAREQAIAGQADEAIATLQEVLAEDPEVIDAWFTLGNAFFQKRDWAKAGESFRKTLAKKPDHDYAMIGLADTLVATGKVDDAVVGYERFLKQEPDNAQIAYRLAQVLLDAGHNDDAERYFRRTLAIEPKTARAEVGEAVVAFRRHDFAAGRQALDRALAIDPHAAHARYNLALILEAEGDLPGASRAYRAELADHPTSYKAHFNLGRLLAGMGDKPGSVAELQAAVATNPDFGVGHLFLAQALLDTGDLAAAATEAHRGLALDSGPYAPLGHYVLADLLERQGRRGEAAVELRLGREAEARAKAGAGSA